MTERVERRVARALLRLVQEAGRRVDAGVEIDFPVSRQDIAEMTGTTLYTVSRLLSSWEERGIVRSGRQRIILTTPHALVALAEVIFRGMWQPCRCAMAMDVEALLSGPRTIRRHILVATSAQRGDVGLDLERGDQ